MKIAPFALATVLAVGLSGSCLANDMVAAEQVAGSKLAFRLKPEMTNATLSVAGPNNFHVSAFSRGGALAIDLSQFGSLSDGSYDYQLTASGPAMVVVKTPLDNGRPRRPEQKQPVGVSVSGTFQVKGGAIVKPDSTKSERRDR